MPNLIQCQCGQQLRVHDGMEGQQVRCPTCNGVLVVPRAASGFAPLPSSFTTAPKTGSFGAPPNPAGGNQFGPSFAPPERQGMSTGAIVAIVLGGVALIMFLICGGAMFMAVTTARTAMKNMNFQAPADEQALTQHDEDYADARKNFQSTLIRVGPSPQQHVPNYQAGVQPTTFRSGDLILSAYLDPAPADGAPRPAVLFLHSGFAFGDGDYEAAQPYRDAGFVVMQPVLRGENGQPGDFSMLYDEVDDVLAAADTLAALPYVDRNRLFVAGHMEGGTLAILAAMTSNKFRAAASFSSSMNLASKLGHTYNHFPVPFDADDPIELEMRSPISFPGSFKCPARLYYPETDIYLFASNLRTAELARGQGLDVAAEVTTGNSMTVPPASIQKSILFFNELRLRDPAEPAAASPPAEQPAEPQ